MGLNNNGSKYPARKISFQGKNTGLMMELYVGYPPNETFFDTSDGFIISIQNKSDVPFVNSGLMTISAGEDTNLIVNRNYVTYLGYPYGDCLEDITENSAYSSKYFDYIVRNLKIKYSEELCYSLCLQSLVIEVCNCSVPLTPIYEKSTNFCTDDICYLDLINNFEIRYPSYCEDQCPFECSYIEYSVKPYKALYPTYRYIKVLSYFSNQHGFNFTDDIISKAFLKVNIFYESMKITVTKQSPSLSTVAFFSNIGGTLGLCMGMSILSFVEIIELFYNFIIFSTNRCKNQSLVTPTTVLTK